MDNQTAKQTGRRAAGSYGRPGSKYQKRAASKGVRAASKLEIQTTLKKETEK